MNDVTKFLMVYRLKQIMSLRIFSFRILSISMVIFWASICTAQKKISDNEIREFHKDIDSRTDKIFDSLVSFRRDLHRHPELSGKEERTAKKIAEYLTSLGLEVTSGVGGHGVVGILQGAKEGRKIAWRADIDALASDLPDVVEFESTNPGVRHICGHDVHATIGLGIADVLAEQRERLGGTVYFIFQPSEENIQGAKAMIEDNLFDIVDADEIYALHMSPFPAGTISTKPNGMYGDYKRIEVTIKKNGDSTAITDFVKNTISSVQNVNSPEQFNKPMNLGDPQLGIASPNTIYNGYVALGPGFYVNSDKDSFVVSTHISSSDLTKLEEAKKMIGQRIAESQYRKYITGTDYVPVTFTPDNDEPLVRNTTRTITEIYGKEAFIPLHGLIPGGHGRRFCTFSGEGSRSLFFPRWLKFRREQNCCS